MLIKAYVYNLAYVYRARMKPSQLGRVHVGGPRDSETRAEESIESMMGIDDVWTNGWITGENKEKAEE